MIREAMENIANLKNTPRLRDFRHHPPKISNLRYFETLTPQIKNTSYLGYICLLKTTPNLQFKAFGRQSEAKMHPKSRIRAIRDTFAPSKPPQICISKHLGYGDFEKYLNPRITEQFGIRRLRKISQPPHFRAI